MSKLIDKICALRDLTDSKQYDKLKFCKMQILQLKDEIQRQIKKKVQDYNHQLEFTAQDLRELAQDINGMLNDWQKIMYPDDNIKQIKEASKNGELNLVPYQEKIIPIIQVRSACAHALIEFLNFIEYQAVFLYYVELASNDKIAINYTERVI